MIFQSLGSNYSFLVVLRALFGRGNTHDRDKLVRTLEKHYGGFAYLYDKGRNALASGLSGLDVSHVAINGTTCSVVIDALEYAKSDIIYLDIGEDGNFTEKTLEKQLQSKKPAKVVIVQNTYGNPCDITAIEKLVVEHKMILIEDLAHSIGQKYADGREVGTVGDIVMLSFGRDKIIDAVNGGALIIREPSLLSGIKMPYLERKLSDQVRDRFYPLLTYLVRYTYRVFLGKLIARAMYSLKLAEHSADGQIRPVYKMTAWQARLINREFANLKSNLGRRRKIVDVYRRELADYAIAEYPLLRYPIRVANRQELLTHLSQNGYHLSDTWYDTPIGPSRKFDRTKYPSADCPHVTDLSEHIINLPTHRYMTPARAKRITTLIKEFYA